MAIVINFSQTWALYCLVQFYAAIKDELAHIKPLAKFLVFKSIVFLTWWQGVAIAILYSWGFLKGPVAEALQFKSSIQDFIICIEVCVLLCNYWNLLYGSISTESSSFIKFVI
jgi:Organic solute transporter Ostalpha